VPPFGLIAGGQLSYEETRGYKMAPAIGKECVESNKSNGSSPQDSPPYRAETIHGRKNEQRNHRSLQDKELRYYGINNHSSEPPGIALHFGWSTEAIAFAEGP
jgi:hypothetical protein